MDQGNNKFNKFADREQWSSYLTYGRLSRVVSIMIVGFVKCTRKIMFSSAKLRRL